MPRKLIGIFGGAFDPVHNGHTEIARYCIESLNMEKVVIVPTGASSLNKKLTDGKHRLAMLNKVFNDAHYEVSVYELTQSEKDQVPSYTINTLKYLTTVHDLTTYVFILGMDALLNLDKWYQWESLLDYCHLLVIQRECDSVELKKMKPATSTLIRKATINSMGGLAQKKCGSIYFAKFPLIPISSTEIRMKLSRNENVSELISPEVARLINEFKIYHSAGHKI
jgi:nicotinate-nucleotide adenylyltransferase